MRRGLAYAVRFSFNQERITEGLLLQSIGMFKFVEYLWIKFGDADGNRRELFGKVLANDDVCNCIGFVFRQNRQYKVIIYVTQVVESITYVCSYINWSFFMNLFLFIFFEYGVFLIFVIFCFSDMFRHLRFLLIYFNNFNNFFKTNDFILSLKI